MDRKPRTFPRLPRALHAELLRQVGTYGMVTMADRLGMHKTNLSRIVHDSRAPVWRSTLEKIKTVLTSNGHASNGHGYHEPEVPSAPNVTLPPRAPEASAVLQREQDFTLRVTLPVKRAERLVAHCDLVGISLSQFVGSLIDKHLDEVWGQEK